MEATLVRALLKIDTGGPAVVDGRCKGCTKGLRVLGVAGSSLSPLILNLGFRMRSPLDSVVEGVGASADGTGGGRFPSESANNEYK